MSNSPRVGFWPWRVWHDDPLPPFQIGAAAGSVGELRHWAVVPEPACVSRLVSKADPAGALEGDVIRERAMRVPGIRTRDFANHEYAELSALTNDAGQGARDAVQ